LWGSRKYRTSRSIQSDFHGSYFAEDKYLEILWLMRPYGYEDNTLKIVDILREFSQDS
jgi:hypothetical protein